MKVSAITNRCPKPCFTSEKQEYENPVNRKTERNLTVLQASGVSLIAGVTAGGIASCLIKEGAKHKVPLSVAAGAADVSAFSEPLHAVILRTIAPAKTVAHILFFIFSLLFLPDVFTSCFLFIYSPNALPPGCISCKLPTCFYCL